MHRLPPTGDPIATAEHPNEQAVVFEQFDLSGHAHLLLPGQNILAVHGMTLAEGSPDGLILPVLEGKFSGIEESYRYFHTPTPGESNEGGLPGFVADVTVTPERGIYASPIEVTLANETPGVEIRYTLDGSPPSDTYGQVYTVPLTVGRTTVLRAAALLPGYNPSQIATHTYLFPSDIGSQPGMKQDVVTHATYGPQLVPSLLSLPTLSIVMDEDDMFHPTTGIYANYLQDGVAWESARRPWNSCSPMVRTASRLTAESAFTGDGPGAGTRKRPSGSFSRIFTDQRN